MKKTNQHNTTKKLEYTAIMCVIASAIHLTYHRDSMILFFGLCQLPSAFKDMQKPGWILRSLLGWLMDEHS